MARKTSSSRQVSDRSWKDMLKAAAAKGLKEKPCFSGSWLLRDRPGEPRATLENRFVRTDLFADPGGSGRLYSSDPYEYNMGSEEVSQVMSILDHLRESPPPQPVLDDEQKLRSYIEKRAQSRLSRSGSVPGDKVPLLARICAQYSSGYGALEHLLRDERVQDIYVDPSSGHHAVRVSLGGLKDPGMEGIYPTNLLLTRSEVERVVSILRYTSERPFSEANPVLECDLGLYNARATAVSPPLSPAGISIAIRKHSHDPWTLLGMVLNRTLSPQCAGFLSLCVDGRCTILIAGPRGAGKSSLLGALLFEVDMSQRAIVIEDTPELPITALNELGYKVLGLTVGQGKASTPEKALRTALRLGESVLVMGEVRGPETRVLYEAMSAGTAGSSVMGTFHADSADAVYKRAVDDLGVPPGSFSATDLVVVTGLVRPGGKRARLRRVVQVAELVKTGEVGRFRDLFTYDPRSDSLVPAKGLQSSSVLKRIGSTWGMDPTEMQGEMELRGRAMESALETMGPEDARKPAMTALFNTCFREVRESMVEKGKLPDGSMFITELTELIGTGGR